MVGAQLSMTTPSVLHTSLWARPHQVRPVPLLWPPPAPTHPPSFILVPAAAKLLLYEARLQQAAALGLVQWTEAAFVEHVLSEQRGGSGQRRLSPPLVIELP
jgi:hypothetical protein